MSSIEVSGLRFGYGSTAVLDGLDFHAEAGDLVAVIGASGCGKTTLLRLVAGLERPDAGIVTLDGVVVDAPGVHVQPHLRRVGLVPQEGALFPHLDVAANIGFGLPRRGPERRARIEELLELAGLQGLGGRMPRELSGGQQQRVALARSLAPRPRVVLLDEPFGPLDAQTRVAVRTEVSEMLRQEKTTGVLVTHDRAEALTMADQVAVMVDGRVLQHGRPFDVYDAPVDHRAARLLGPGTFLPGEPSGPHRVRTALGDLEVRSVAPGATTAGEVTALVRPEQVVPDPDGVAALVRTVDFTGAGVSVGLELPDGRQLRAWVTRVRPHAGETLTVTVRGGVHLVPAPPGARP
ncbi:ABC transporter ATP-binding protein [Nocardioides solisilvae]|uniref:ABC transporter ATP-binding protein n=1 Tax=Nocardioides solisilvae TaxID=1542435 RepID=UPI000D74DDC7|nr:ABC transporter ATP-binding protein [Nocardioides solisilvae]